MDGVITYAMSCCRVGVVLTVYHHAFGQIYAFSRTVDRHQVRFNHREP